MRGKVRQVPSMRLILNEEVRLMQPGLALVATELLDRAVTEGLSMDDFNLAQRAFEAAAVKDLQSS